MNKIKQNKKIFMIVGIVIILVIIYIVAPKKSESDDKSAQQSTIEKIDESEITEINYLDLHENYKDYSGKWVRIAGCISSVNDNVLGDMFITFKDGLSGLTGEIYCTMSEDSAEAAKECKEGDYVCIVGKVGNKLVETLNIDDCYIDKTGSEAQSLYDTLNRAAQTEAPKEQPESENSVTIETQAPAQTEEQLVFEQDNISIYYLGEESSSILVEKSLKFQIVNNSDKNIIVSSSNCSVNDFATSSLTLLYSPVAAGKKANDILEFYSSDLETNGITSIEKVEFSLNCIDSDTFSTIWETEPITITLN